MVLIPSVNSYNADVLLLAQMILSAQFPEVHGFQETAYVTKFNSGRWVYHSETMKLTLAPSVQIHHTGAFHWVTNMKDENESIYPLAS